MKLFTQLTIGIICILIFSCQQQSEKNNLTDDEIRDLAIQQGNLISEKTQMVLGSKLKEVIQNEGIPQALKYCNVNAFPIVDSLQEVYGIRIRRTSQKMRNPSDTPDKMEQKIIDEYMDVIQKGETPTVKVVLSKKNVDYFKPIILSASLCLNCHGNIGSEIKYENYTIIKALYTEDKATGYKMGDLRGIWSIKFERNSFQKN